MTSASGLTNGLTFLTSWLSETSDANLETSLREWVRQAGWSCVGIVWPLAERSNVALIATAQETKSLSEQPAELGEVMKSFHAGHATVVWQVPGTAGRLYALLTPPGSPAGVIWAERASREPWADVDRAYFTLAARLLERSAGLAKKIGPTLEPARLEQRLKDAAVIAGRMAHDFDNILTGIMGFADLSQPLLAGNAMAAKYVAEIGKVGQRGIVFTQQLHQLSRSSQVKPQPGSVAGVLSKEEQRLRPTLPAGATLTVEIPPGLPAVAMEAGPLLSVLRHLLDNAVEATAANGKVVVTARMIELTPAEARSYLGQAAADGHVEVTVRDHGPGIKPEVRAKLFAEPFFTTKIRHRGLGLATVFRVLYAHRGGIRIDAATPPDLGTVVRVVIPLAPVRAAVAPPATAGTPAYGV